MKKYGKFRWIVTLNVEENEGNYNAGRISHCMQCGTETCNFYCAYG